MTIDDWCQRIATLWPFTAATYQGMDVDYDTNCMRHVALHMAKDAGKAAAAIEPEDHGRPANALLLQRATRNQLVNALRLCNLLGVSPTALLNDYAHEVSR